MNYKKIFLSLTLCLISYSLFSQIKLSGRIIGFGSGTISIAYYSPLCLGNIHSEISVNNDSISTTIMEPAPTTIEINFFRSSWIPEKHVNTRNIISIYCEPNKINAFDCPVNGTEKDIIFKRDLVEENKLYVDRFQFRNDQINTPDQLDSQLILNIQQSNKPISKAFEDYFAKGWQYKKVTRLMEKYSILQNNLNPSNDSLNIAALYKKQIIKEELAKINIEDTSMIFNPDYQLFLNRYGAFLQLDYEDSAKLFKSANELIAKNIKNPLFHYIYDMNNLGFEAILPHNPKKLQEHEDTFMKKHANGQYTAMFLEEITKAKASLQDMDYILTDYKQHKK